MPEDMKRRVQKERREETRQLAETLEHDGTLDLERLGVLIREEKAIVAWSQEASAKSKNAQYVANMAKAKQTAEDVVGKLRRAGKLYQNRKPKAAAALLREVCGMGSKVGSGKAATSSVAMLYLEYLAAGDVTFQQWLADGQPPLVPAPKARKRTTSTAASSNRPEDYR